MGLVLVANAARGQGTNYYWRGAGTGGNTTTDPADPSTQWGEAANWVGGIVPTGGNATAKFWYKNAGATYIGGTVGCNYLYIDGISSDATFYVRDGEHLNVSRMYIGSEVIGNLVQSGGMVTTSHGLGLGGNSKSAVGTYTLNGGELNSSAYHDIYLGHWGLGKFVQNGGTHNTNSPLIFGYEFDGHGEYYLNDGQLNATRGLMLRTGFFVQDGGNSTVNGLSLRSWGGKAGHYNLIDGNLVVNTEYVGRIEYEYYGTEEVLESHFTQDGGVHTVTGNLYVGLQNRTRGRFLLNGGSLVTNGLQIGIYDGTGAFEFNSAAAQLQIGEEWTLGANASFSAVDGTLVRMTGAKFGNQNTQPRDVVGFSRLKMIFEEAGGLDAEFEVACKDMGAVAEGFIRNFALRTLQIGDAETGQVVLTDTFNNYPSWEGDEALYVRNLIVGSGSHLNLNGLKVYHNSLTNQGMIDYNGGELVYAPLPPDILSVNASALSSGFVPDGLGSGTLTVSHIADIGVELEDSEIVYSDSLFEMTALLLADNSADGIASGEFGDGVLIIRDGEGADLLTGDLIELVLDEVIDGASVLAGQGLFNITGGSLEEAFMLPMGDIVQITFQIDPADIDDFSVAFTGISNITLMPVPEPAMLSLLVIGGLAMLRHRRK